MLGRARRDSRREVIHVRESRDSRGSRESRGENWVVVHFSLDLLCMGFYDVSHDVRYGRVWP